MVGCMLLFCWSESILAILVFSTTSTTKPQGVMTDTHSSVDTQQRYQRHTLGFRIVSWVEKPTITRLFSSVKLVPHGRGGSKNLSVTSYRFLKRDEDC